MKKVEIDADTADRIVVCSLEDSIQGIKDSIKELKKNLQKNKKDEYTKQELMDCMFFLDALEKTYEYYGGNLK